MTRVVGTARTLATATSAIVVACMLLVSSLSAAPRRVDLDEAERRLMELEREFEIVVEEYNLVHEQLGVIQTEMGRAQLEVRSIERRMSHRQVAAVDLAQELYKGGPSLGFEAVLGAHDLADMMVRIKYLKTTQVAQTKVFERLSADQDLLDAQLAILEKERSAAQVAEARLASLRADIEGKVASQRSEIEQLTAAIEAARSRREQRAAEAAERLAEQAAEDARARLAQAAAQPTAGASVPVTSKAPN
ncbi:MAG: hypothetical protein M3345_07765, partial [Actinomycetota bacterium]|nr:hypothetical protein [Actinomycetota bacterium]